MEKPIVLSPALTVDIDNFRRRILINEIPILDPPDTHHEFVNGAHGQKLNFDRIEEGTSHYNELVSLEARTISQLYKDRMPDSLVGVANGANRLSRDIAAELGERTLGLFTQKNEKADLLLDEEAHRYAASGMMGSFALVVEDAATTGSNAAQVVERLRQYGIRRIEVFNTWQRCPTLPYLDTAHIVHHSLIVEPLPTYSPDDCRNASQGFCHRGVDLIRYER